MMTSVRFGTATPGYQQAADIFNNTYGTNVRISVDTARGLAKLSLALQQDMSTLSDRLAKIESKLDITA